ncbi:transporter substrate-binding domain-containing protein [Paraglaciecola aquimarina]|uniref:Transporter substrate-binding domain-containing protein n=1 Tax=Paraglaciecola algarum TaxID=3050085 RepID=A0ABS9D6P5_9ALTE|nr:transporter substrate-binding domain-containing protein [Paraglaciecola sp. G1-23]MCF2948613.1 transporter substrate-binding domain-containing protein [Paraglaciecola sp. G1-23]
MFRMQSLTIFTKYFWLVICIGGANANELISNDKLLRVAVIYIEEPPYLYTDANHHYHGIFPSLAQALSRELGLELKYVPTGRKGLEKVLLDDEADMTWLSPKWVSKDTKLQFSAPLIVHREFLYSFSPFNETDNENKILFWLKNKSVCIRQYYKYPNLDPYFQTNIAQAVEVSNQTPLIKLFRKGRCDLLYLDEYRAAWMTNRFNIKRKVWRSSSAIESSDLSFVFGLKWKDRISKINQVVAKIKDSGELDSILANNLYPIDLLK